MLVINQLLRIPAHIFHGIDWLQLILYIIPVIFSIIAIIISVLIAMRQNKISLFEKRYFALSKAKELFDDIKKSCDAEKQLIGEQAYKRKFNDFDFDEIILQTELLFGTAISKELEIIKEKLNSLFIYNEQLSKYLTVLSKRGGDDDEKIYQIIYDYVIKENKSFHEITVEEEDDFGTFCSQNTITINGYPNQTSIKIDYAEVRKNFNNLLIDTNKTIKNYIADCNKKMKLK